MPWKETCVTDQRLHFLAALQTGELTMAELCREFQISRKTGYKWRDRYATEHTLTDHSSAPHTSPQATPPAIVEVILACKAQHPTWGPRLLRGYLTHVQPETPWPAASTIGELLKARGLTRTRKRLPQAPRTPGPLRPADGPNAVWSIDFKGWFRTGDGQICYPLTLLDVHSRFLLRCQALATTDTATLQPILTAAFLEYGLPARLRSDNGPPFGSIGLGGLSRLAVWCLKLGIRPEYITPGRPQQNGHLERFHGTLQREQTHTPAATRRAQQRAFDTFRTEYNTIRPHSALGYVPPATVYTRAARQYPHRGAPAFTYAESFLPRLVHTNGYLKWRGDLVYVSETLIGDLVGLLPLTARYYALYVGPLPVAVLDDTTRRWIPGAEAASWLAPLRAEDSPPG